MSQHEEYSPYMSNTQHTEPGMFSGMPFGNYIFSAFGIFIIIIIGIFIYFAYFATPSENFINASQRSDRQSDQDYLEIQIDLLNRQQHKNLL